MNILVTKPMEELQELESFLKKTSCRLIAQSFIQFELVEARFPLNYDAIFFGSKNAYRFFAQQIDLPKNVAVACIGETTRNLLEKAGVTVDFYGTHAGNPDLVAMELKQWLGDRKMLIPLSDVSNRSMSRQIPTAQCKEVIVYRTKSIATSIQEQLDWVVFTSPSNLRGFLASNEVSLTTKTIAWGKTTEKAMKSFQIHVDFVLENSSEAELIELLASKL